MANLNLPVKKFGVAVLMVILFGVLLSDMISQCCIYWKFKKEETEKFGHAFIRESFCFSCLYGSSVNLASHFIFIQREETSWRLAVD